MASRPRPRGTTPEQAAEEFAGKGYGELKSAVSDAVIELLSPIQDEYARILVDKAYLTDVMKLGADKARYTAMKTVRKVYRKMGFDSEKA